MSTDGKIACAELIQNWGFARDQGYWDDLAAIFHPGGEIAVSWFAGPMWNSSPIAGTTSAAAASPSTSSGRRASR